MIINDYVKGQQLLTYKLHSRPGGEVGVVLELVGVRCGVLVGQEDFR